MINFLALKFRIRLSVSAISKDINAEDIKYFGNDL